MSTSPAVYVVLFAVWAAVSIPVAYVWYEFTEKRRCVGLVSARAVLFVLAAGGATIVGVWNDVTAATSELHQRVYLFALALGTIASSVAIGLKIHWSRFALSAARASAVLMLLVLGIGIGSTDFADARLGDVVGRFAGTWVVLSMLVLSWPRSTDRAPEQAGAPPTARSRPRLAAVPPSVDRGG